VLSTILESLYLKVLVTIVVQRESTLVYIQSCSKKDVVDEVSTEFKTTLLNDQMHDFIQEYIKESPYFYISILDTSIVQGALPTCEKNKLSDYYDLSMSKYKCFDQKWSFYTAKNDIYEIEHKYEEIGIDMIFSPFVVLANFFQDKINNNLALYVLIQDGFISIAVFENSQLLYAEHLDMLIGDESEDILLNEDIDDNADLDLDGGINLEDIDVDAADNIDSLDEFGDIEDLDSLEDIDEFSDSKDVEEELQESDDILPEDKENEAFNEDYQRFSMIQSAVSHFYKDDRYESRFIENVYIADGAGVSNDLKKYLEEEMFFNVYVRQADLGAEVCELSKMELGL